MKKNIKFKIHIYIILIFIAFTNRIKTIDYLKGIGRNVRDSLPFLNKIDYFQTKWEKEGKKKDAYDDIYAFHKTYLNINENTDTKYDNIVRAFIKQVDLDENAQKIINQFLNYSPIQETKEEYIKIKKRFFKSFPYAIDIKNFEWNFSKLKSTTSNMFTIMLSNTIKTALWVFPLYAIWQGKNILQDPSKDFSFSGPFSFLWDNITPSVLVKKPYKKDNILPFAITTTLINTTFGFVYYWLGEKFQNMIEENILFD